MKRFPSLAVLCLFLLSTFAAAADAPAGAKDKKFLLDYMKQTQKDFEKSVKGLSDAQWKFKAAPERWSIAETAEHIALSEEFLSGMIADKILKSPPATDEQKQKVKGSEEMILSRIPDRSQKAQAPEMLRPRNKWPTQQELVKAFKEKRKANIKLAKSTSDDELRNHVAPSPIGDFDAYQWFLFVSAHSKRHTAQIEEVKADPNFPRN